MTVTTVTIANLWELAYHTPESPHYPSADLYREEVVSLAQAQQVRRIRNTCRAGFATDNTVLTIAHQAFWWTHGAQVPPPRTHDTDHTHYSYGWALTEGRSLWAWLYYDAGYMERDSPVGFGLLRRDPGDSWLRTSVAVPPYHAGHGYGKAITSDLVRLAQHMGEGCRAAARLDNPAAVKLHPPELWQRLPDRDGLAHFQTHYTGVERENPL